MKLKSIFLTLWIAAMIVAFVFLGYSLTIQFQLDYVFSALAISVWLLYFLQLVIFKSAARNDEKLPKQALSALVLSFAALMATDHQTSSLGFILAIVLSVLLAQMYIRWYSAFDGRNKRAIRKNMWLPKVNVLALTGVSKSTHSFLKTGRKSLWVVYRGNWCPFCVAQIKELFAEYEALAAFDCDVFFISPQSQKKTAALAKKFMSSHPESNGMHFLQDPEFEFAKAIESVASNGTPFGFQALGYDDDTVMPTVLLCDEHGKILYADLTDNYRVRPEPQTYIELLKTL